MEVVNISRIYVLDVYLMIAYLHSIQTVGNSPNFLPFIQDFRLQSFNKACKVLESFQIILPKLNLLPWTSFKYNIKNASGFPSKSNLNNLIKTTFKAL